AAADRARADEAAEQRDVHGGRALAARPARGARDREPGVVQPELGTQRLTARPNAAARADDLRSHDARRVAALQDPDAAEAAGTLVAETGVERRRAEAELPAVARRDAVVGIFHAAQVRRVRRPVEDVLDVLGAPAGRGRVVGGGDAAVVEHHLSRGRPRRRVRAALLGPHAEVDLRAGVRVL